jgi:hypothetical protein
VCKRIHPCQETSIRFRKTRRISIIPPTALGGYGASCLNFFPDETWGYIIILTSKRQRGYKTLTVYQYRGGHYKLAYQSKFYLQVLMKTHQPLGENHIFFTLKLKKKAYVYNYKRGKYIGRIYPPDLNWKHGILASSATHILKYAVISLVIYHYFFTNSEGLVVLYIANGTIIPANAGVDVIGCPFSGFLHTTDIFLTCCLRRNNACIATIFREVSDFQYPISEKINAPIPKSKSSLRGIGNMRHGLILIIQKPLSIQVGLSVPCYPEHTFVSPSMRHISGFHVDIKLEPKRSNAFLEMNTFKNVLYMLKNKEMSKRGSDMRFGKYTSMVVYARYT